jgi:hypothetical protein
MAVSVWGLLKASTLCLQSARGCVPLLKPPTQHNKTNQNNNDETQTVQRDDQDIWSMSFENTLFLANLKTCVFVHTSQASGPFSIDGASTFAPHTWSQISH